MRQFLRRNCRRISDSRKEADNSNRRAVCQGRFLLTWLIRKLKSPTHTKIEEKQSVMVRLILTAILLVLLTACGTVRLTE